MPIEKVKHKLPGNPRQSPEGKADGNKDWHDFYIVKRNSDHDQRRNHVDSPDDRKILILLLIPNVFDPNLRARFQDRNFCMEKTFLPDVAMPLAVANNFGRPRRQSVDLRFRDWPIHATAPVIKSPYFVKR